MDLRKHEIKITDMKAFKVGNAQNIEAATGCTAIICEKGAYAGVSVVGGSPASRETQLLNPVNTVQQIHAVSLSGGSAYGLEAGDGIMQFLEEKGADFGVATSNENILYNPTQPGCSSPERCRPAQSGPCHRRRACPYRRSSGCARCAR